MRRSPQDDDAPGRPCPDHLRALLAQYLACPVQAKPPSFLAFVLDHNPHVFSHHDHDRADYHDHVWRIGGLYLCRGCTTVIVVTLLSFTVALLTRWPVRVPTSATAVIFVAMLLCALLPLGDGPRTLLHDLRRVALGCLLGSAVVYLFLCDDWMLRSTVVGVYLSVLAGRRLFRRRALMAEPAGNGSLPPKNVRDT